MSCCLVFAVVPIALTEPGIASINCAAWGHPWQYLDPEGYLSKCLMISGCLDQQCPVFKGELLDPCFGGSGSRCTFSQRFFIFTNLNDAVGEIPEQTPTFRSDLQRCKLPGVWRWSCPFFVTLFILGFKAEDGPGWPPVLQPLGQFRLSRFAHTTLISEKFDPLSPTFSLWSHS